MATTFVIDGVSYTVTFDPEGSAAAEVLQDGQPRTARHGQDG
jgi:hypothetical protein